ncbi:DNA invertase Pin-like site-specific DNA recombinase [Ureibacillus xyleni]|uniref:DNA invertase Pin-like site-specific DNA recombinase n=1 Tax=Ureibacillus xyleni TaxID=614648 RepID=A0A285R900_9BACL|nr:recombinase family protein [Ureibacillus xyleni]SOB90541.1 DNA invertase Pin-like site-specific DNA recombinase [Ureibacillus xyleni]
MTLFDTKLKTYISYCRKSITVSRMSASESVQYQKAANQRYAELHQLELVKEYSDVGYSGKDTNRPEIQEMLWDLKSGAVEADILVIYSVDRFGRDLKHNIETMLEILNYVKQVVFVAERMASDSEHFKILFLMLTGMAQENRERILQRMADGRKAKVLTRKSFDGNYPALGYVKNEEKLVPATFEHTNDLQLSQGLFILQAIFHSYLYGMSLRQIAKMLNQRVGFTRRGKEWTYKSVQYILSNEIYCGVLKGTLENVESYLVENANVEAVVDPLVFELVQQKLRFEKSGRKRKTSFRSPHFTLCLACSEPLVEETNSLRCYKCWEEVELVKIEQVLLSEVSKLIQGALTHFNLESERKRLLDQYLMKRKLLVQKIKELDERRKRIELLPDHHASKKKMLSVNTEAITAQQQELLVTNHLIDFVKSANDKKMADMIKQGIPHSLIALPYLVTVDFLNKQIQVLFHREVFQSVGEL